jgi:hypothetical protein
MASSSTNRGSPARESSSSSDERGKIVKHWFYEHKIDGKQKWDPFTVSRNDNYEDLLPKTFLSSPIHKPLKKLLKVMTCNEV